MNDRFMIREMKNGIWTVNRFTLKGERQEPGAYATSEEAVTAAKAKDPTLTITVIGLGDPGASIVNRSI